MARLEGQSVGYLVAIPVKAGQPPPLNASTCPVPRDADALYLHDLAVHPDARGAGVGEARQADALITMGGASVGEADFMVEVLRELGTVEF